MNTTTISDARSFSLESVQQRELVRTDDISIQLLCFEAGQKHAEQNVPTTCVYQVLEGEALVRKDGEKQRLGKGKLLTVSANQPHQLENAGGGLLVVMATHAL